MSTSLLVLTFASDIRTVEIYFLIIVTLFKQSMKKQFTIFASLTSLAVCIYISSCKTKKAVPAVTTTVGSTPMPTYMADIKPILDANCAATCHSAEKHKHNIDLSTYESSKEVAKSKSFLGAINHEAGYDPMPPISIGSTAGKLDQTTIDKITAWVKGGMAK